MRVDQPLRIGTHWNKPNKSLLIGYKHPLARKPEIAAEPIAEIFNIFNMRREIPRKR